MIRPAVRHVRSRRMRKNDRSPYSRDGVIALRFHHPFRWLPRHGQPLCVAEWFSQRAAQALGHPLIYTIVVLTSATAVQVFGLPWVG